MTLLEYIEQGCKYHDTIMKYVNFKTFVESLHRKSNSALIESISTGVSVMLEAEISNFQVHEIPEDAPAKEDIKRDGIDNKTAPFRKSPTEQDAGNGRGALTSLIDTVKTAKKGTPEYEAAKKKVIGFLTQVILKIAKYETKGDTEKFTDLSSEATIELMQKFDSAVVDYDPELGGPETFVKNKFILPAQRKLTKGKNLDFAYTNNPSDAMFAHLKGDKASYGKIVNPDTNDDGSTVTIKWDHTGKKDPVYIGDSEEISVKDLKFYNMESEAYKTSLASTGIDSSEGGQTETLGDTAAFADKSEEYEAENEKHGGVLDSAIEWTADALATRLAKKPDGSVDDAKHEKLYDSYYKFLQNYAYKKDSTGASEEGADAGAGAGESALEKKEKRTELVYNKTKALQRFVISLSKIFGTQEDKFKKILGEDFDPNEVLMKFKEMKAAPPENSNKILANSENIKKVLGDKLYDIIYSLAPQQKQIDIIDRFEEDIKGLNDVRTGTKRVGATLDELKGSQGQDPNVDMKTGKALIELLKKFHSGE